MSRYYEKQREERGLGSRAEQTDRAIMSLTHEVGELRRQVAAVRAMHRKMPVYPLAEQRCYDDEHPLFECSNGDVVCLCLPPDCNACSECRDEDGSFIDFPCPTIHALGVE